MKPSKIILKETFVSKTAESRNAQLKSNIVRLIANAYRKAHAQKQ